MDLDAALDALVAHYQPVVRIADDSVLGYEALARFPLDPLQPPDVWLRHAGELGRRAEAEVACVAAAVAAGAPPGDGLLFVNLSPSVLRDAALPSLLAPLADRLVLELSEQEQVDDYGRLDAHLEPWRAMGARIAVDDTGSGWASLRHVVRLAPDFIKLDRSLVHGIDRDTSLRALVASFMGFASESGAAVIAEGVETMAELEALQAVGVPLGQGWLLGRPGLPWPAVLAGNRPLRLDRAVTAADACALVCRHLGRLGVMPSAYLERDGLLRCVAHEGLWQVLDGMSPEAGITGMAYRLDRLVVEKDTRAAAHYLEAIPGVVAEACAPLRAGGRTIGALNIDSTEALTPVVVDELVRCAELLGSRLADFGTAASKTPVRRLGAAAMRLGGAATEREVIDELLAAATDITSMSSAFVLRRDEHGGTRSIARGSLAGLADVLTPEDEAALLQVVASVRSCYSAGDERAVGFVATESLREAGAQTVALLPMAPGPGQSALVAVFDERPHRLDTDRVELLELLASAASSRLQTLSSMTELRRRATEDTLTGAGNRLAFGEALQRWEREALRGALAVVDVDGFKRVNDTWGHGEGDRLLVELTESLRQAIRPGDAVFRLGGDEFAVLLPGVVDDAEGVANRLVLAAGPTLASRGASISVGVAPLLPGSPAAEAVRLADRALYAAKRRRPAVHGRRAAAVECAPQVR